jgi:hypothetical protein
VSRVRWAEALLAVWAATVGFLTGWQTVVRGGSISRIFVALAALALGLAIGNVVAGIVLRRRGRSDLVTVAVIANVAAFYLGTWTFTVAHSFVGDLAVVAIAGSISAPAAALGTAVGSISARRSGTTT